ncbi:MAG: serine hydrolase domain-containing protein [Balneolaceae bacterium]|nr:serine hydrolase domain-containing protein [Balneolaceae bacterium]
MKMKLPKFKWFYPVLFTALILSACSGDNPAGPKENKQDENNQVSEIQAVDQLITEIMNEYSIPGASLTISEDGRMVYSRNFGYANTEENIEMTDNHVFRIASCSKTFTGAAIMKLVQEGQLSFSDKVFGEESIFGMNYGTQPYGNRLESITLEDLLHHTLGGWGVSSGGDPIDYQPQLNHGDFISYVIDNWSLSYEPGEQFVYSNTGYFLLARIVEQVSGTSFKNYLKEELMGNETLSSLHVTTFDIEDRQPNEVEYYGQGSENQYVYTIADRRDGDAGVVISAEDLLKFVNAIDGFNTRPDILNSETMNKFTEPSAVGGGYAAGISNWQAQNVWFHYGSLPGTRTAFMRHANGKNIVLLFNSRAVGSDQFVYDIQGALLEILNNNQIDYPDIDLFEN